MERLFAAGLPSLILPSDAEPRPGTLTPGAIADEVARLFREPGGKSRPDRARVLEGLALLWNDHWGEAHEIAQSREGEADFDLLHAMVHCREGDFANAGYWFRNAGKHPSYPGLERKLAGLPTGDAAGHPDPGSPWSPAAFLAEARKSRASSTFPTSPIRVQAELFHAFAEWLLRG